MPTLMFMRRPASVIGVSGLKSSRSAALTSTSGFCFSNWFGRSPSTSTNSFIDASTSPGCATQPPS